MNNHQNIPLPNKMVEEIDSRRGLIKRATYVQALILAAWKGGTEVVPITPCKVADTINPIIHEAQARPSTPTHTMRISRVRGEVVSRRRGSSSPPDDARKLVVF